MIRHEGSQVNGDWGPIQGVGIQDAEFGSSCEGQVKPSQPWSLSSVSSGQRRVFQILLWWPLHRTGSRKDCGQERWQDVLRTRQQVSDFTAKGKSVSHIATVCITILEKNYFCLQKHLKLCKSLWIFFLVFYANTFSFLLSICSHLSYSRTLGKTFF